MPSYRNRKPFLLANHLAQWPLRALWAPEALLPFVDAAVPPLEVPVFYAKDNCSFLDDDSVVDVVEEPLRDVLRCLFARKEDDMDERCRAVSI